MSLEVRIVTIFGVWGTVIERACKKDIWDANTVSYLDTDFGGVHLKKIYGIET